MVALQPVDDGEDGPQHAGGHRAAGVRAQQPRRRARRARQQPRARALRLVEQRLWEHMVSIL